MICKKVTIKNPTGLHLRPAGILCNEAMKYQSLITFDYDGGTANAKSVLSVLGACVKCCLLYTSAPTGRAAKRMTETTGYEAQTIHRLLDVYKRQHLKKSHSPLFPIPVNM